MRGRVFRFGLFRARNGTPAMECTPVLPEASLGGALSAQLRRPRPQPTMSALVKGFGRRPFAGALGLGAGPASESLVRRKPREGRGALWLGGPMGILGSRTDRPCGGGGGGQPVLSSGANTTRFFGGEDASGGCGRSGWRESAEVVRTSRSCSGARGEAKAISIARREAPG
jgi:hypothetical protein